MELVPAVAAPGWLTPEVVADVLSALVLLVLVPVPVPVPGPVPVLAVDGAAAAGSLVTDVSLREVPDWLAMPLPVELHAPSASATRPSSNACSCSRFIMHSLRWGLEM